MADVPPAVVPEELIGERIGGRFVVERLIGTGPLSTAFRAHDDRLHRRVTVKLFHPRHPDDAQAVDSQLAAARAVARLSHEHIALVIDRTEHEGMPIVVLEYVRGENLQERIERYAPLGVAEVVGYGLQVARALAYAHGQGVAHGNLRPENVLLSEERDVKLVDFGGGSLVAHLVGDPYASPELREAEPGTAAEAADDVYALGALLFTALTERSAVPGIDTADVQLLRPDVTPRLAATIARALSLVPADRHMSMRELAAELAASRDALEPALDGRAAVGAGRAPGAPAEETRAFSLDELDEDEASDEHTLEPVVGVGAPRGGARRRAAARAPRSPRETRARLLAWSIVVLPLAALVLVGVMIAGERSNQQVDGDRSTAGGATRLVPVVGGSAFDPEGDSAERDELVPNAWDGDAASTWQTEGYDRPDFGSKKGVGIAVQLGEEVEVHDVAVLTALQGWRTQVFVADAPHASLDEWTPASKVVPVEHGERIPVDTDGEEASWVLLWITALSLDVEDTDKFRARVGELRIYATASSIDGAGSGGSAGDGAGDDGGE